MSAIDREFARIAAKAPASFTRISSEVGDPGERAYRSLIAAGKGRDIVVSLNGRKQEYVIAADETEGWIKRSIRTQAGWVNEIVRGRVAISIK